MSLYNVEFANETCIKPWMALVKIVSDNFPGLNMDDYLHTLKKNVERKTALCVKDEDKIIGILLFSPRLHCLSCMAVHPEYRKRGVASALVSEMLKLIPDGHINVTTFRVNDEKGAAPRALYQKFGFEPDELIMEFGYPVQRFVLHRA